MTKEEVIEELKANAEYFESRKRLVAALTYAINELEKPSLEKYASIIPTAISNIPGGNQYVLQISIDDNDLNTLGTDFMISNKLKVNIS